MKRSILSQKTFDCMNDYISDISVSSSNEYEPTDDGSEGEYSYSQDDLGKPSTSKNCQVYVEDSETSFSSDCEQQQNINISNQSSLNRLIHWTVPDDLFEPAKIIPPERSCKLLVDITKQSSPLKIFHKVFPHSLYLHIVNCTNQRLLKLNKAKKKKEKLTDKGEIQKMLGCMLIMSYNHLPSLKNYWSQKESMGNRSIQNTISRDRFMLVISKLYFAPPEKPANATKTYYVDELISCLKYTFSKCREDSQFQSIDESMTKFKGRSSLKQYMPLKPIKRGIKLWLRCDSDSGYTYDINVYSGKDSPVADKSVTLGERVVKSLAATIKVPDVVLCFDRFFTGVNLLETINFPAIGTIMANRKNVPGMPDKLKRGEFTFRCTDTRILCVKWQDTKEVLVMSNCHKPDLTKITKKTKTGEQVTIDCPQAIALYRQKMGGVDRADQYISLYNQERKSTKWWKKVFYTCLSMCVTNAWIMYNDLRRNAKKVSYLTFLVDLSENLIAEEKKNSNLPLPKRGPSSKKKKLFGTALHLPVEGQTRRRCARCAEEKKQKRTKTVCQECQIPLCKDCFMLYHTK
ncbi:piggyBac transposable element-derived protein 4-like [Centruroides vittatus]|uniref:piggyBac transposable element-derived protein 4-like n=1 Tax=Centruroides vittatus TaxID=120091 RepID=UPI00350F2CC8